MSLFHAPGFDAHEHVSFFADDSIGLRAIVAIHRTGALGTAGGGCRMWPYADDDAALRDALRLSRAMTYKLALVELPAGGAKAVIIGDPAKDKSEALLLGMGRAVDRLGGRFIVGEDVGTNAADLAQIARATMWVSRDRASDTTNATAEGVLVCMRTAIARRLGQRRLDGIRVAVQGLGHVGAALCARLAAAGARLWVSDVDRDAVARVVRATGAVAVAPEAIFDVEADVFSPCALADALDAATIPRLRCSVVVGSANNQLAELQLGDELARRGILHAPDIVANAGGALGAASAVGGDGSGLRARLDSLGALLDDVFARAERQKSSPQVAAERLARERFANMGGRP